MKTVKLIPLKNPLEDRPTVMRVYRSLYTEIPQDNIYISTLSQKVYSLFKTLSTEKLKKVKQKRIFGVCKSKKKTILYPIEFIPVMINIINQCHNKYINENKL